MILNTGTPRSVVGNAVSGGIAGLLVASYMNYKAYKNGAISQNKALRDTIAVSAQAAIATGCAIGVANALGRDSKGGLQALLESSAYILAGIAGVYAIDKLSEMGENQKLLGVKNGKSK